MQKRKTAQKVWTMGPYNSRTILTLLPPQESETSLKVSDMPVVCLVSYSGWILFKLPFLFPCFANNSFCLSHSTKWRFRHREEGENDVQWFSRFTSLWLVEIFRTWYQYQVILRAEKNQEILRHRSAERFVTANISPSHQCHQDNPSLYTHALSFYALIKQDYRMHFRMGREKLASMLVILGSTFMNFRCAEQVRFEIESGACKIGREGESEKSWNLLFSILLRNYILGDYKSELRSASRTQTATLSSIEKESSLVRGYKGEKIPLITPFFCHLTLRH